MQAQAQAQEEEEEEEEAHQGGHTRVMRGWEMTTIEENERRNEQNHKMTNIQQDFSDIMPIRGGLWLHSSSSSSCCCLAGGLGAAKAKAPEIIMAYGESQA